MLVFDLISVGLRDRYVAFGAGGKIQHVIEHWLTFDVFAVVNWKERYDFFSAFDTHKIECNNSILNILNSTKYYSMLNILRQVFLSKFTINMEANLHLNLF